MRADMTPEEVRAAGIYLNGGRRRGWKRRLSALLDTPEATISAWTTRSPSNARPISGVAAVAIKLLVAMLRQELMTTAHPEQAGDALAERILGLLRQPDPVLRNQRPITIETPAPALPPTLQPTRPQPGPAQPAQWLGIQNPRRSAPAKQEDAAPLPFGIKRRDGGSRSGRPGSSA